MTAASHPPSEPPRTSTSRAVLRYLRENLVWWLTPIVLVIIALLAIALFGASATLPYMYQAPPSPEPGPNGSTAHAGDLP